VVTKKWDRDGDVRAKFFQAVLDAPQVNALLSDEVQKAIKQQTVTMARPV